MIRQPNLQDIMRDRRRVNWVLLMIFVALLLWVALAFKGEVERAIDARQPLVASRIRLDREAGNVWMQKVNHAWQITEPYQGKASNAVIDALLERLKRGCRVLSSPPTREPQFYASIFIDDDEYQVGELNQASNEVYVKHASKWLLCDTLIASMALAPALNFIDKQLYDGELTAIVGSFGRLTDFTGVDLSVLQLIDAETAKLPDNAIATLTFEADSNSSYQTFLSENGANLLLFDTDKSLIYVLATHPKLNAVLGL